FPVEHRPGHASGARITTIARWPGSGDSASGAAAGAGRSRNLSRAGSAPLHLACLLRYRQHLGVFALAAHSGTALVGAVDYLYDAAGLYALYRRLYRRGAGAVCAALFAR